jgi:DNA-binding response OmpR family regulator
MNVLVVEDNELVAELVRAGFEAEGWVVDVAFTCAGARRALSAGGHAAVVLDIELPDGDGFSVLTDIRSRASYLPVVMLTARGGPDAVVKGLVSGADDYVAKPFDMGELIARLLAVVRRTGTTAQEVLQFGDVSFNRLTRETSCRGRRLRLTPKEQTLLEQLMLKPGSFVAREDLLERVWRINFDPGSNLLDAHVARLRGKLKNATSSIVIVTRRATGFALQLSAETTGPA